MCTGVDNGTVGTVLELLCHCSSGFGKRLFRKWVCHPLRAIDDIEDRFSIVDELSSNRDLADTLRQLLRGLPDLERSVSLIHVGTCKVRCQSHAVPCACMDTLVHTHQLVQSDGVGGEKSLFLGACDVKGILSINTYECEFFFAKLATPSGEAIYRDS
jgi:DNA mismatch repair ATPase MutS